MRILHVSTDYKPIGERIGHGGVERLVTWLARAQRDLGHEVTVATVAGAEEPGAWGVFPDDAQALRQHHPQAYERTVREAFDRLLSESADRLGGWDLVHDHMGAFVRRVAAAPDAVTFPLVLSTYAQRTHFAYRDLFGDLAEVRRTLPWLLVSAGSHAHREHLSPVLRTDLVVHAAVPEAPLASGLDTFAYLSMAAVQPGKQQLELARLANERDLPFLFGGPLIRADDVSTAYADRFLREVRGRLILEEVPEARAVRALKAEVARYGTVYVGEIVKPMLRDALFDCASKLVLLNDTDEVFSLVVQEALSRGVPVVSGPFPSAHETLQGFGAVVSDLEPRSVLEALNAPSFDRAAIQAYCRARFDVGAWARHWNAVYLEAAERYRRHG